MLVYLMLAYQHGFQVDSYDDEASGVMTKNEQGVLWISAVRLNPNIYVHRIEATPDANDDRQRCRWEKIS